MGRNELFISDCRGTRHSFKKHTEQPACQPAGSQVYTLEDEETTTKTSSCHQNTSRNAAERTLCDRCRRDRSSCYVIKTKMKPKDSENWKSNNEVGYLKLLDNRTLTRDKTVNERCIQGEEISMTLCRQPFSLSWCTETPLLKMMHINKEVSFGAFRVKIASLNIKFIRYCCEHVNIAHLFACKLYSCVHFHSHDRRHEILGLQSKNKHIFAFGNFKLCNQSVANRLAGNIG